MVHCVSPESSLAGAVSVEVSVNDGAEFTHDDVRFMYEEGAEVQFLTPSRSLMGVTDQVVVVTGRNFEQAPELSCWFGDAVSVPALYISITEVRCAVPERAVGTVYLTVSSTGMSMGQNQGRHFEYVTGGKILQASPSLGPLTGGTVVTLRGVHLTAVSEGVMCRFAGGVPAAAA